MRAFICIIIFLIGVMHVIGDSAANSSSVESVEEPVSAESSEEVPAQPPTETEPPQPESSEDESTEVSPTQPPPEEGCIGDCPEVDPPYGAYLAHERCDQFCQCSHGAANVIDCPGGLHFNPEISVCDWPQAANCTGIGGVEPPRIELLLV